MKRDRLGGGGQERLSACATRVSMGTGMSVLTSAAAVVVPACVHAGAQACACTHPPFCRALAPCGPHMNCA